MYNAYVCVRDKKASTTGGGTFSPGAWRTRDINEELSDAEAICSIAANAITLAAGTYRCLIVCPATGVSRHQARLWNDTDSAVLVLGGSCYVSGDAANTLAIVQGRFTLAAEKVLLVQHRGEVERVSIGFGVSTNLTDEIYTVAEFWREE